MIDKIINFSGFSIDNVEHNIIDDMIEELNVLSELNTRTNYNFNKTQNFTSLRDDVIKLSYKTSDILSNSKSKTDEGFFVNKLFDQ